MVHDAPVVVVPPHLDELAGLLPQHGVRARGEGRVERAGLARGVRGDADARERRVRVRVELAQDRCDVEAVDEQGGAALAARVLEQVEELQSAGVGLEEGEW